MNCTPEAIKEVAGEALDLLNNPLRIANEVKSMEELLRELNIPTDTELLNFLQQETDKAKYTGAVLRREDHFHRGGWVLYETALDGVVSDVRQAIINYKEQVKNDTK